MPKEIKKLIVTPENEGQRIDQFLVAQLAVYSRAQIQKMMAEGAVLVQEKAVSKHYAVRAGEEITIKPITRKKPAASSRTSKNATEDAPPAPEPILLAETPDYLVIEKPSGLLVHPTEKKEKKTLMHWFLAQYPEIKKVGDKQRPGIVHRLDKDVSGVMVIARTPGMHALLKQQFRDRLVHKVYTALVHGRIPSEEGDMRFSIARSNRMGAMAARPENQEGRPAHTYFEVLTHFPNHTLVLAEPKTGRTHQIRVHFFALGNPIVGDPIYRLDKYHKDSLGKTAPRIFLHATELSFTDMSGARVTYTSTLPPILAEILKKV